MMIDAHCHAWRHWPYEPGVPDPARGSAANLLWEMDRASVDRAVVVCASIGGNDDNSADVAAAAAESGGRLVPFVDVDCRWHTTHRTPGGPARLDAAVLRFKPAGISYYMDETASADWLLSDDGIGFFEAIAARRLLLSLACGPGQIAVVAQAARRVPQLAILLHHLCRVRAGDDAALRAVVAAAAVPNLHIKLSGFGYAADDGWSFPLTDVQPVAAALFAAFGAARTVWGSDWPVSQRYMTYRQSLEIVRTYGPAMTAEDRKLVLGGTMARLLSPRLDLQGADL
jgi:L-fuconolactonase